MGKGWGLLGSSRPRLLLLAAPRFGTASEAEGNRRKAAEELGIGERTLYRKLKQYGLG
jgi:hypothetical protein